jgi:DNA mismatch endonuclease (patch repair protein)
MMSAVKARGNKAEAALRRELWRRGYRYRLYHAKLIGRPDIVFVSARVAVFVDGDFWHGRGMIDNGEEAFRATMRTARQDWWVAKLKRNIARDTEVNQTLEESGWRVVRLWESDVKADVHRAADHVSQILRRRVQSGGR